MQETTVVSMRTDAEYDVRIDRATRWGNPFTIGKHGTREEVIEKYRQHLWNEVKAGRVTIQDLAALHGKTLACWCKPQACHGDVLARAAAWAHKEQEGA